MEGLKNIFSQRLKQAHLQFAQANAQTKNCKRACFANRTDTATLDRQTTTEKEGRAHNSILASVFLKKKNRTLSCKPSGCEKTSFFRELDEKWAL